MIDKCVEYLNENGYYGYDLTDYDLDKPFETACNLCELYSDKDGNEVPEDIFDVVLDWLSE